MESAETTLSARAQGERDGNGGLSRSRRPSDDRKQRPSQGNPPLLDAAEHALDLPAGNVLITGLPCGQVGGAPEASICASSASISDGLNASPALTAPLQALQYLVAPRFQRGRNRAGKRVDDVHEAGRRFGMAIDVRARRGSADRARRWVKYRSPRRKAHPYFLRPKPFPAPTRAGSCGREQALGGNALFDCLGQRVVAQALVRGVLIDEQKGVLASSSM